MSSIHSRGHRAHIISLRESSADHRRPFDLVGTREDLLRFVAGCWTVRQLADRGPGFGACKPAIESSIAPQMEMKSEVNAGAVGDEQPCKVNSRASGRID
jgi:hypothetical protein